MRLSGAVIAGNEYLAERAKKSGARNITIIPTVIDSNRYAVKPKHSGTKTVIGWIGSPSTFKYVKQLFPVFEKLIKQYDFELQIVGARSDEKTSFPITFLDWSEETEVASIQNFDIGIMPLEDTPWEKGKCAYKIIQYMACGLPVVASPVGMNKVVVLENETGFLPNNLDEWCEVFQILTQDKTKSCNFGASGRQVVENEYTLQGCIRKLTTVLKTM
jgi:glycosyltransferase involved in cell wall biosynthesis